MRSEDLSNKARKALSNICNRIQTKEDDYTANTINELMRSDLIIANNGILTPTSKGFAIWLFDMEDITSNISSEKIEPCDKCDNTTCNHGKTHSDIVSDALRGFEYDFKRASGVRFGKTRHIDNNNFKNTKPDNVFITLSAEKKARNISKNEAFIMHDLYSAIELVSTNSYKQRVITRLCNDGYIQRFDGRAILSKDNKSIATEEGDFVTLTEKGVAWILFGDCKLATVFNSDNIEDVSSWLWSPCNIISELL